MGLAVKAWVRFPLNPYYFFFLMIIFLSSFILQRYHCCKSGRHVTGDLVDWSNLGMILSVFTDQFTNNFKKNKKVEQEMLCFLFLLLNCRIYISYTTPPPLLSEQTSSSHTKHLSIDESSLIRRKEHERRRKLCGLRRTPHWVLLSKFGNLLLPKTGYNQRRPYGTRRHDVHADSLLDQLVQRLKGRREKGGGEGT